MANKKRLIDANALIAEHCKDCPADVREECKIDPMCGGMMWLIEATTVDAEEVVRCKDCIHSEDRGSVFGCRYCRIWHDSTPKDGYCHEGERREGE